MKYYYKTKNGKGTLCLKHKSTNENYIEISEEEYKSLLEKPVITDNHKRINELKNLLAKSDYKAIKYAEGLISEEDYAPIKAQRQEWRDEIRRLENI